MNLAAAVYRQFRKPTGLPGRLAGWIMANRPSNIERSRWTIELLNIQPGDHVLEIGFGPGLAIAQAARLAPQGRVVGIDHSALMNERARRRNQPAIQTGLVELKQGSLELLPQLGASFDKVFSVNVMLFLPERTPVLRTIRSVLKPDGVLATTVQPRHLGATAADTLAFAQNLSRTMTEAGFRDLTIRQLDLKPIPAVCVLGRR